MGRDACTGEPTETMTVSVGSVTFNSAAHDLRAPLQRVRGRLETALLGAKAGDATDVAVHAVLEDLERVQRTLAVLLQIAQADAAVEDDGGVRTGLLGIVAGGE